MRLLALERRCSFPARPFRCSIFALSECYRVHGGKENSVFWEGEQSVRIATESCGGREFRQIANRAGVP
jgi:hypothetical protein